MKAYYYEIRETKFDDIVDSGIITNAEDTIYPGQNTGIKELPYECEAHHFSTEGYILEGFYFDIPFEDILKYKLPH